MLCPYGHKHKKKDTMKIVSFFLEAPPRIELGIRALQAPALPLGHGAVFSFFENKGRFLKAPYGADYEARTRYLNLGKVALYQMS